MSEIKKLTLQEFINENPNHTDSEIVTMFNKYNTESNDILYKLKLEEENRKAREKYNILDKNRFMKYYNYDCHELDEGLPHYIYYRYIKKLEIKPHPILKTDYVEATFDEIAIEKSEESYGELRVSYFKDIVCNTSNFDQWGKSILTTSINEDEYNQILFYIKGLNGITNLEVTESKRQIDLF